LEGGLAAEEIADRAARLALLGGDGVGIEPSEGAERDRAVVERLGVLPDLLEGDQLADLDVALARLGLGKGGA
jgi:hypothetical protein